jgi:hypothetical protein
MYKKTQYLIILVCLINLFSGCSNSKGNPYVKEIQRWKQSVTADQIDVIYITHLGCRNLSSHVLSSDSSKYLILVGGDLKRIFSVYPHLEESKDIYFSQNLYQKGLLQSAAFKWVDGTYQQMTLYDYFTNNK